MTTGAAQLSSRAIRTFFESAMSSTNTRHNNRFDSLRLLAAWLVLFSHCFPLGGQPQREPLASTLGIDTLGGVGVAIFFVLSGYLVTLSLQRTDSVLVFVRKRAVRIYPALVVTCLLCVLVLGPVLTSLPLAEYFSHSMTWDYLKTSSALKVRYALPGVFTDNPLPNAVNGSLWSLPYELKCYLALMVLGLLPLSLKLKILGAFGVLLVLALLRPAVPPASPFDQFIGLDYYVTKMGLVFALGAAFAAWRDFVRPSAALGLVLLAVAVALPHGNVQLVIWLCGLGMLVLWLALYGFWLPAVPERMGDWSYGAYLYGFPVQQVLAQMGVHQWGMGWFVLFSTVLTLVLAAFSWHSVEKPAMRWK